MLRLWKWIHNHLTPKEQLVLLGFCGVLLLGMGLDLFGWQPLQAGEVAGLEDSLEVVTKVDSLIKVDIRSADKETLMALPGIGAKRADDIIKYRSKTPFVNTVDILAVKGIGIKTYSAMFDNLVRFGKSAPDSLETGKKGKASKSKKLDGEKQSRKQDKPDDNAMVNLNTAGMEELMSLKGIGKVKAQAILDYRAKIGKYDSVEQLLEVDGIGAKTLAKIKDRLKI